MLWHSLLSHPASLCGKLGNGVDEHGAGWEVGTGKPGTQFGGSVESLLLGEVMLCGWQGYWHSWCHSRAPLAGTPEPCAPIFTCWECQALQALLLLGDFLVNPPKLLLFPLPRPPLSLITSTQTSPIPFLPFFTFLSMENITVLGKRTSKHYSSLVFYGSYAMPSCWQEATTT